MEEEVDKALDDLFRALEDWYDAWQRWPREPKGNARLYQAYQNWLEAIEEDTQGENKCLLD